MRGRGSVSEAPVDVALARIQDEAAIVLAGYGPQFRRGGLGLRGDGLLYLIAAWATSAEGEARLLELAREAA